MYKHILIPTDGSELSKKAIEEGVKFARDIGAEVTGFIATPNFHLISLNPTMVTDTSSEFRKDSAAQAARALDAVKQTSDAAGVPCTIETAIDDEPAHAILDAAQRNQCDLIVMASHGRSGMSAALMGSETAKVISGSKVPVLVYH